jgi:AcrR family transcriptional regulator
MSVHAALRRGSTGSLLDVAVEVLLADPSASQAQVAEAAGIGRTTLHKYYATRDDLLRAVGHRALDRWEEVVDGVDGGLPELVAAIVPIGPHMAFLWRTPMFDHAEDIIERWRTIESRTLAALKQAQARGRLRPEVPDFWLLQTFYSLIYVAAESVHSGHLAPRDAPDLVVDTLLNGLGGPR